MPGFDGTGPRGMGPRTGGGRGFCPLPTGQVPVWPGRAAVPPAANAPTPVAPAAGAPGVFGAFPLPWAGRGIGLGGAYGAGMMRGRGGFGGGGFGGGRRGRGGW